MQIPINFERGAKTVDLEDAAELTSWPANASRDEQPQKNNHQRNASAHRWIPEIAKDLGLGF